jgi:hypothetical protein
MWTLKQIAENPASELALEGLVGDSGVTYDFVLTNLGRLDFPLQYGDLKVQAVYGPVVRPGMPGKKSSVWLPSASVCTLLLRRAKVQCSRSKWRR